MSTFTTASDLANLDPRKRTGYSIGMVVGADELSQDQRYLTNRDERHQRALHGWGVVSGLGVQFGDDNELQVLPGTAIDAVGRLICIDTTQCADVLSWVNAQEEVTLSGDALDVWVSLCWAECETDLLPIASGPCKSLEDSLAASRVADSYELQLSLTEPPTRGELEEIAASGTGSNNVINRLTRDGASLTAKRNALERFVLGRGDPAGFANRCLDPVDNGCVPLARVRLRLSEGEGGFVFAAPQENNQVTTNIRPVVVSTALLQQWLLNITAGGDSPGPPEPEIPALEELTNVDVDGAARNSIVVRSNRGIGSASAWEDAVLELDLLQDVNVAGVSGSDMVLGFDSGSGQWRPRTLPAIPDPPPAVDGAFVSRRPDPYAIVAAGLVSLPASRTARRWSLSRANSYGGLELVESDQLIGVLRFDGYEELLRRDDAVMIVKLTAQAPTPTNAQVIGMTPDGIIIGLHDVEQTDGNAFTSSQWRETVAGIGLEFPETVPRLHIEVSAFGAEDLLQELQEG